MRVLVTGGAGFIGSAVADVLTAAGHEVVVLDALLPAARHGAALPAYVTGEVVVADLRDADIVRGVLAGVDAVCHQAAMVGLGVDAADLPGYAANNDLGTAVLLAEMAAVGVGRLVLASSMVVYGEGGYRCPTHGSVHIGPRAEPDLAAGRFEPWCPDCGRPLDPGTLREDTPLDPRNAYAASKVAQEHYAAAWARSTGGGVIALRYHNVYGARMPRDTPYAGVAAIFRSMLEAGRAPQVFEDGGQRRDFVAVADVARANLCALEMLQQPGFAAYNVASGEPHTVGEMAVALATAYGGPDPVVTGAFRLGDVRHIVADPTAAARDLGFRAGSDFADGMREFAHAPLR